MISGHPCLDEASPLVAMNNLAINPNAKAYGNGVLPWFESDEFDTAVVRAEEKKVEVVLLRHRHPVAKH